MSAQNDYPKYQVKSTYILNMTVRLFYPTILTNKHCRFLYYYSSVILNLSKNSFFYCFL